MKKSINSSKAPKAIGPYSQAIAVGNWLFVSGQIPMDLEGNVVNGSIEDQVHQLFSNLKAVLQEANMSLENAVKVTMYITDFELFSKINSIYETYFEKPYPARETVAVKALPKNVQVEISLVAYK